MDTATGRLSGAGWFPGANGSPPFTFVRWKPQATVRLNHYVPDLGGSHDVKVGYEFQIDSSRWAPRLGLTFAPVPRTVFKAHYGRYYVNLADAHEDANPASTAWIRYGFLDPNANGLYDGPGELGAKLDEQGATGAVPGAEGTPVDPGLPPEYVDELNLSLEHEVASDTSLRFSYVRKDLSGDTPPPRARAAR